MLELPYINMPLHGKNMMQYYDEFSESYNKAMNEKRALEPENKDRYQTLKPTHRELFNDLIMEIGKNMMSAVKLYEKLNRQQQSTEIYNFKKNTIVGPGYYVCSTNRYQLAKHSKKDLSTIYRNISRLMEAGVITDKINHGHFSDFDLHIKSDFLLVSDKANPLYNPYVSSTTKDFSISQKFAKCKAEEKEKEHLINKIYSEPSQKNITTDSGTSLNTGAITGTAENTKAETEPISTKGRDWNAKGGVADLIHMKADRGYDWTKKSQNPAIWHNLNRLTFSSYFVDYLIEKIYNKRAVDIMPETRIKAIEYAELYYFPSPIVTDHHVNTIFKPCTTYNDYATRLNGLKWCIDAANRYAARRESYFVLPLKYIDIENKTGFINTLNWFKTAKQN